MVVAPALGETIAYTLSDGDLIEIPLPGNTYRIVGPTGYEPTRLAFSKTGVLFAVDRSSTCS